MGEEGASTTTERRLDTTPASSSRSTGLLGKFASPRMIKNIAIGFGGAFIFLALFVYLGVVGVYDLQYAASTLNALRIGAKNNLVLVGIVISVGMSAGLVFGWVHPFYLWLVRFVTNVFVDMY